jgi:signal transduction histidine kinase/HAMP domain-containing protein
MTRFLGNAALMILATALLVVAAAYLLYRGITRPLSTLIDGTQRMARGELDIQVPVVAGDEVGELADSFNRMAHQLKDRQERLLATLDDLDRSRREILRERDFKETLVETIDIGLLTLDGAGRVTSINGPAARLLGLSREAEGALDDVLAAWPSLLTALAVGLRQPDERWHDYADVEVSGSPRVFRLSLVPSAAGDFSDRILTIEDLTERVGMRRQLARMERMAALGRLSAGIAHEVRNPLTGISLLLDDLHDRLLNRPTDQELIRRALNEIERLEGLVNGLLDFAAAPRPRLAPANIGRVLRETLFLIRKPCERQGIRLAEELAEDLPSFPLDAHKLKQALLNLFNNALDAMPDGGRLDVAASRIDGEVRILIRDSGAGIPAEQLPLIFEPFYTGKGSGTGLGLSISQNILADHGGRITVTSTPGVGSEFTLFLPIPEDHGG